MQITHLSLTNYRNYSRLELDLPEEPIILQGDNAQGKTNFLESIHVLATTRSPRSSADRELVNWLAFEEVQPYGRITAKVKRSSNVSQVELLLAPKEGEGGISRRFRVNGAPKRAIDVIGLITVVLFSPLDVDLVGGAPSGRRRYLDIMNSQADPLYLRSLQKYNRVLAQRNSLLRLIRDGSARASQLDYWDAELVEHGSYIAERRADAVAALNVSVKTVHPLLTDDREFLRVDLQASICGGGETPPEQAGEPRPRDEWKNLYVRRLHEMRSREVAQGLSLVGPHRDDLRFSIDGADTTTYGSRGQQRTAALSVKLGEAEFIQRRTGEQPILLLDDVTSELDAKRRRQVIHSIQPGQQVLITCTDLEVFEPEFLAKSRIYRVKRGQIELAH